MHRTAIQHIHRTSPYTSPQLHTRSTCAAECANSRPAFDCQAFEIYGCIADTYTSLTCGGGPYNGQCYLMTNNLGAALAGADANDPYKSCYTMP